MTEELNRKITETGEKVTDTSETVELLRQEVGDLTQRVGGLIQENGVMKRQLNYIYWLFRSYAPSKKVSNVSNWSPDIKYSCPCTRQHGWVESQMQGKRRRLLQNWSKHRRQWCYWGVGGNAWEELNAVCWGYYMKFASTQWGFWRTGCDGFDDEKKILSGDTRNRLETHFPIDLQQKKLHDIFSPSSRKFPHLKW